MAGNLLNKNLVFPLALLIIAGCNAVDKWTKHGVIPKEYRVTRTLRSGTDTVRIMYTGCGGLVIGSRNEAVLVDPYFKPHRPRRELLWTKIAADSIRQTIVLDSIRRKVVDPANIKAALITHAHYDHLEDLPGLLRDRRLAPDVKILGSPSVRATIVNYLAGIEFINGDTIMYVQGADLPQPGSWQQVTPSVRVLPIRSDHADHFFGYKAMSGDTDPARFTNFRRPYAETVANDWKEGTTYSFLVDVASAGDTLRIFVQTSACNPDRGFPPPGELRRKRVDLAILCVASHHWAEDYPEKLLQTIKPLQTMAVHWEDFFFGDILDPEPKQVKGTPVSPFLKRVRAHYRVSESALRDSVVMPKPLTVVKYAY